MDITIRDQIVKRGNKQMPVDKFCRLVHENTITGMSDTPIPDNVRWLCECGNNAVYIIELQPELRTIVWADYDYVCDCGCGEMQYSGNSPRTIATPYVVLMVPFIKNTILGSVSVFYRNSPLRSINDQLCHTNLKNISITDHHPDLASYLCLQGLEQEDNWSREQALHELVNHLWTGEFNNEIDSHGFTREKDPRLSSIENWEKYSKQDPKFVLGVKWLNSRFTVKEAIQGYFRQFGVTTQLIHTKQLGNLILAAR